MGEIRAPITGNVWQILVAAGDRVEIGATVALLESMKLEIPVESEMAGVVARIVVQPGDAVGEDDVLIVVD